MDKKRSKFRSRGKNFIKIHVDQPGLQYIQELVNSGDKAIYKEPFQKYSPVHFKMKGILVLAIFAVYLGSIEVKIQQICIFVFSST